MLTGILWVVGAYLYGSVPVVYLIGRLRGVDLFHEEDMHITLWRDVGRREALAGIAWDLAKGGIAVLVVDLALGLDEWVVAGVGLAVVLGELWPVFLRFRGEKSNTTGMGVDAALVWQAIPFLLGPIIVGALVRTVPRVLRRGQSLDQRMELGGPPSLSLPLGMFCGFCLFPLGAWVMGATWERAAAGAAIFVLIVLKRLVFGLREDIAREGLSPGMVANRLLFDRSRI